MCKGFLSKKRTIENYVHPDAVSRLSQGKIELGNELDLDYDDLAAAFRTTFEAAKIAHGKALGFFPVDHERKRLSMSSANNNCKKILTAYIMRNMTVDEVMARGRYTTPEGEEGNEILEWLDSIRVHI